MIVLLQSEKIDKINKYRTRQLINERSKIMKMSRLISFALICVTLAATPVHAQRGGGGRSGGSSGSYSSSRSSGSSHSSSRSSSNYSSSRSSSSGSSYSSSRSSSNNSSSASRNSHHYNSSDYSRSNTTFNNSGSSRSANSRSSSRSNYSPSRSRTGSVPDQIRSRSGASNRSSERGTASGIRANNSGRNGMPVESGNRGSVTNGRPSGTAPTPSGIYGRPGRPGPMPPSCRPIHPAPYFMHPHHHCMVHCHRLFWDPFPPRPYYWPGFWLYCNSYWYDYHVTDVVVVREYVKETFSMDLITYAISGDYMYALVNDPDGHTYLQIYDKNDKLLAEQQVSRKYRKLQVDPENGGCWIMKKRDKDPLLFFYTTEGELLIYEADK